MFVRPADDPLLALNTSKDMNALIQKKNRLHAMNAQDALPGETSY